MKQIVLVGGGGHCKVVIDAIRLSGDYQIYGIVDPGISKGEVILGVPVLGNDDILEDIFKKGVNTAFVTVGSTGDSSLRIKLYERLKDIGFILPVIVHPKTVISQNIEIQEGTFIAASVTVNAGTKIGRNTILNTSCSIDHDCVVGDHVHIAPGVILSAGIVIGDRTHVGTGTKVANYIRIGKDCMICMGEVITGNVPDRIKVRTNRKIFIIAEAGVNHNGCLETAKKLVDVAVSAGCDAVKFQSFCSEKLASGRAQKAQYQKSGECDFSQLAMLKKLELGKDAQKELYSYCENKRIMFLSSAFDLDSIELLDEMDLGILKIPSGEINNLPYLRKIGVLNKKIILSTGMSDMEEVKEAIDVLMLVGTLKENITLLHCNTDYPTAYEDVNLTAMLTMRDVLGVKVGYSDHTLGIEVAIAAVAIGADVIEKHFTLDKTMEGPDHRASLDPDELKSMVIAVRNVEKSLGRGIKRPSRSELNNKKVVRKSLVAARDVKKGEIFSENNITVKRPADGINPMRWDEIIGQIASKDFKKDEFIEL